MAGQKIFIDTGIGAEDVSVVTVGTSGASLMTTVSEVGATVLRVASAAGFSAGQTITVDSGLKAETGIIASTTGGRGGATITITAPLTAAHANGTQVSGTGITLSSPLTNARMLWGAKVTGSLPTPGAPNQYIRP